MRAIFTIFFVVLLAFLQVSEAAPRGRTRPAANSPAPAAPAPSPPAPAAPAPSPPPPPPPAAPAPSPPPPPPPAAPAPSPPPPPPPAAPAPSPPPPPPPAAPAPSPPPPPPPAAPAPSPPPSPPPAAPANGAPSNNAPANGAAAASRSRADTTNTPSSATATSASASSTPSAVPCDNVSKYTVPFFLGTRSFQPAPNQCLFYTRGLSDDANRATRGKFEKTIWEMWPCALFRSDIADETNPLRCIFRNNRLRTTYFQNMSEAMARSCSGLAQVMTVDVNDIPNDGIWATVEEKTLVRGGICTQIIARNVRGGIRQQIFPQLPNVTPRGLFDSELSRSEMLDEMAALEIREAEEEVHFINAELLERRDTTGGNTGAARPAGGAGSARFNRCPSAAQAGIAFNDINF